MSNHRIITTKNVSYPDLPEPIKRPSTIRKLGQGLVAFVFLAATVYLFGGLHQYLQFRQTPEATEAGVYEPVTDLEVAAVPTTVFVLRSSGTSGDVDDARRLINRANQILAQAAVTLDPVEIEAIPIDNNFSGPQLVSDLSALRELLPPLSADRLHVVIVTGLGGVNGVAFSGQNLVAVAEYTTSFDFRVLAHEVGHALDLSHVSDRSNLMYSGSAGTELSVQQVRTMQSAAMTFSGNDS